MKKEEVISPKLTKVQEMAQRFANSDKENAVFVIACSHNDDEEGIYDGFSYASGHAWKFGDGFCEIFKKGFADDANEEAEELAMSILFGMELLMREHSIAANNMCMCLLNLIKNHYKA